MSEMELIEQHNFIGIAAKGRDQRKYLTDVVNCILKVSQAYFLIITPKF